MHPKAGQQCRGQSMVSCCPRAGLTVAAPSQGHGNLWGRLQPGEEAVTQPRREAPRATQQGANLGKGTDAGP